MKFLYAVGAVIVVVVFALDLYIIADGYRACKKKGGAFVEGVITYECVAKK